MFPMPRVVYSMASDGLIFKRLAYVSTKFKTPIIACLVTGLFAGFEENKSDKNSIWSLFHLNFIIIAILTLILDLNELIDMMSM